jgi:hypothetical protein
MVGELNPLTSADGNVPVRSGHHPVTTPGEVFSHVFGESIF